MNKTYKVIKTEVSTYIEMTDGEKISIVPEDSANTDYQDYLKSLEENTNGNN